MQFASMSLGIFDFLIEWLTQFLIWIVKFAIGLIQSLINLILYGVCVDFLEIVNFIQKVFYKLCGLDTYWYGGTEMKGADPLLSIITDKSMLQVLLALTLVAVAMVIVATIIQVLRTEFSTEGSKNTKGQVFGQAIKSIVMFALVPICSAGGIIVTNALLKAVNAATSLGAESSVGGAIYVASTYGSNKVRNGGTLTIDGNTITIKGKERNFFGNMDDKTRTVELDDTAKQNMVKLGIATTTDQTNRDEVAQAIDNAFRSGYFNFANTDLAQCFYDVASINYIIFLGGGILAAYTMLMASFGMIMRMYKGAVLFVISPAMSGLMPLDNGSAFKQWRTAFIKQLLAAYGTIVAMNLLFILLPIVSNINLFGASDLAWKGNIHANLSNDVGSLNAFVQMLFTLTGLFMLKDMSGLIANMIGGDDALASGEGMAKKVGGTVAKMGLATTGIAAGAFAKVRGKSLTNQASSLSSQLMKETDADKRAALEDQLAKVEQKGKRNANLAAYGRKGFGALTGSMTKFAKDFSGGVIDIKSPEERYKAKQQKQKDEDEARKKRIEEGVATFSDRKLSEELKDPNSKAYRKRDAQSYGAETIKSAAKDVQERRVYPEAVKEFLGETSRLDKVKSLTDTSSSDSLLNKLGDALKSGDSESANALIDTLRNQGETFEEMKDLLIKLTSIQNTMNSFSSNSDRTAYMRNSGFTGTDGALHYAGLAYSDANNNKTKIEQTLQTQFNIESDGSVVSGKSVPEFSASKIEEIVSGVASQMQKKGVSAKGNEQLTREIKKDLEEILQKGIEKAQKKKS